MKKGWMSMFECNHWNFMVWFTNPLKQQLHPEKSRTLAPTHGRVDGHWRIPCGNQTWLARNDGYQMVFMDVCECRCGHDVTVDDDDDDDDEHEEEKDDHNDCHGVDDRNSSQPCLSWRDRYTENCSPSMSCVKWFKSHVGTSWNPHLKTRHDQ